MDKKRAVLGGTALYNPMVPVRVGICCQAALRCASLRRANRAAAPAPNRMSMGGAGTSCPPVLPVLPVVPPVLPVVPPVLPEEDELVLLDTLPDELLETLPDELLDTLPEVDELE